VCLHSCVCVCVFVHVHVCMCVCVHVHMFVYCYMCVHVHMFVYCYMCVHVCGLCMCIWIPFPSFSLRNAHTRPVYRFIVTYSYSSSCHFWRPTTVQFMELFVASKVAPGQLWELTHFRFHTVFCLTNHSSQVEWGNSFWLEWLVYWDTVQITNTTPSVLPAKSTRFITLLFLVSDPISFLMIWSKVMVTTVWARLLVAFMLVDATVRLDVPEKQGKTLTLSLPALFSSFTIFRIIALNLK